MRHRLDDRLVRAPMPLRPRVSWPDGKLLALWHAPNVEHYDYLPPGHGSPQGRVSAPDVQHYMHRDAGNRTGFWRLLRSVDEFEIPSTVSLSLSLLEEVPEVRDAVLERGWEVMSHGISNLRPLYDLTPEQEDEFLARSQLLAETYTGTRLKGMLGPKISGTDVTCDLMVRHGMTYHADWVHDEQPRPLRTASGQRLVSIPYSYVLNDVPQLHVKHCSGEEFVDLVRCQVGRLLRDAERDGQGRVACVATHPFVAGQPWFARYLRQVFEFLRDDDRIWLSTAGEITDHFLAEHHDEQWAFAQSLQEEAG